MTNFIEVTVGGDPFLMNIDRVVYIEDDGDGESSVRFMNAVYNASESISDLKKKILGYRNFLSLHVQDDLEVLVNPDMIWGFTPDNQDGVTVTIIKLSNDEENYLEVKESLDEIKALLCL